MITEKWKNPLLVTFLILALNERFANSFLEFCKPPRDTTLMEHVFNAADRIQGALRGTFEATKLKESHKNIRITMQLFKVMKDVIKRNLKHIDITICEVDDDYKWYPELWQVKLCIDREVEIIRDELKKPEALDDLYRLEKAGTLTAVLMIKSMAYKHCSDYTNYADLNLIEGELLLKKNFVNNYMTRFAVRINSKNLIDTIIKLTEGAEFVQRNAVPVADVFNFIFMHINTLDEAHQKLIASLNANNIGRVTFDAIHVVILLENFVNMLNRYNSITPEEITQEDFKKYQTTAYAALVNTMGDVWDKIESKNDPNTILDILRRTEIKLAEEFGLYGDIDDYEKENLNQGTNLKLLIGRMENNNIILYLEE